MSDRRPLHEAFPVLARKLPFVSLAQLPTPVVRAEGPLGAVVIKCDGQTHPVYGGNKVRKLEYLLGQALSHGCPQVATFGAAGSNHATATAVHAHALGLGCISFLSRQRPTPWIADNLRRQLEVGARIVFVGGDRDSREQQARDEVRRATGRTWRVPMGGSSCAGTIGYVNAAFELVEQISAGELAKPESIYVPLGTMGTAVGLAIGLLATGLEVPIKAVRVVHPTIGGEVIARRLFTHTVRLLHTLDPSFPSLRYEQADLRIDNEQFGGGYAQATDAAKHAREYAKAHWGLTLETTYSGKTVAALLADASRGLRQPLYWATYADTAPAPRARPVEDLDLPAELLQYF